MSEYVLNALLFVDMAAFLAVLFMHLIKKDSHLIWLYALQSMATGLFLLGTGIAEEERSLIMVAALTIIIKAIAAPIFFFRLMDRFGSHGSSSSYLSTPVTLAALMALVMFAYSSVFQILGMLLPGTVGSFPLSLAAIFMAIFLMINRRGVFSQMIGILALENSIVLLTACIGIKQPIALEVGIISDIALWIVIANAFISMIYRQFGSLSTSDLKQLTEE
jgi:hydrogenase-4 component E